MRNLKKVLGLVLCLAMMLSIMVVGAGAAFSDQSSIDSKHKDAVDMCVSLNIINGYEDGSFKPNDNVTREQMAKMICVLDNGGKEPQGATGNTFTDVAPDRWSNKFIEACASRGVVAGMGDGTFNPTGDVTASQAAKMLLVELGYKEDLAKYTGAGWDTRVNVDATKNGYYEDLEDIDVNAALSREHAAQMIWNALQADEITYNYTLITDPTTGQLISKEDPSTKTDGIPNDTLLEDKYGASVEQAYMTGIKYDSDKEEYTYTLDAAANFNANAIATADDPWTGDTIKSTQDFSDLFGMKVKVVYKDNKLFGITAFESTVLTSGVLSDLPATVSGDSVKIDGTTYDLDKAASATPINEYNKVAALTPTLDKYNDATDGLPAYYAFDLIDNDDDGDANVMVVHPAIIGQVTNVTSKAISVDTTYGAQASYKFDDGTIYDGPAKDDYILITAGLDGKFNIEKLSETINGTIGKINSYVGSYADEITIDGTSYLIAAPTEEQIAASSLTKPIEAVSYNGHVFYTDTTTGASVDEFAMVTAIETAPSGLNSYATAELLLSDGTTTVVKTAQGKKVDTDNNIGDTGTSQDYSALVDKLVYFEKSNNKSDVYILTEAVGTDYATYEFDAGDAGVAYDKSDAKIGTYRIKDDAVIFVKDGDDWTVINGSTLKTKGDIAAAQNLAVYAEKDSSTGYTSAILAAFDSSVSAGTTKYAYVVSTPGQVSNSDGDKVAEFKIWDGSQIVTVTSKDLYTKVTTDGVAKNTVIKYSADDSTVLENIVPLGAYSASLPMSGVSAVMSYDGKTIAFAADSTPIETGIVDGATVTKAFNITSDTVVLYIDRDEVEGAESGTISLADKAYSYADPGYLYYNTNAYYLEDADNEDDLALLVIETNKLWEPDTKLAP